MIANLFEEEALVDKDFRKARTQVRSEIEKLGDQHMTPDLGRFFGRSQVASPEDEQAIGMQPAVPGIREMPVG